MLQCEDFKILIVLGPCATNLDLTVGTLVSKLPKQHRIFVVDDEPVIASTLGIILSQQGYEVTAFTNPVEALQAIQSNAPEFLIADVVMPEMSGIELAIVMRETCPGCEVLLFSGQMSTFDMLEDARDRGHRFDVLTKPVHPDDMLERVRSGLGLNVLNNGSPAILH